MTDEQWLWLFVNQSLDNDEKLDAMCDDCRHEVTHRHKCIRCGKDISSTEVETCVNLNFDEEKYEAMKNGTYVPKVTKHSDIQEDDKDIEKVLSDVDMDLINQIIGE